MPPAITRRRFLEGAAAGAAVTAEAGHQQASNILTIEQIAYGPTR